MLTAPLNNPRVSIYFNAYFSHFDSGHYNFSQLFMGPRILVLMIANFGTVLVVMTSGYIHKGS
jgi:hypothetical protein